MAGLWLTDHDMIRDLPRSRVLLKHAKALGIKLGLGTEITVDFHGREHHLLGYFPDSAWEASKMSPEMLALQKACAEVVFRTRVCVRACVHVCVCVCGMCVCVVCAAPYRQVKSSRENRNTLLVAYVNEQLAHHADIYTETGKPCKLDVTEV